MKVAIFCKCDTKCESHMNKAAINVQKYSYSVKPQMLEVFHPMRRISGLHSELKVFNLDAGQN